MFCQFLFISVILCCVLNSLNGEALGDGVKAINSSNNGSDFKPSIALDLIKSLYSEDSNILVIKRMKRQAKKYLGCFQDKADHRMFRGYVTRTRSNTIEKCVEICQVGGFIYAGLSM